MERSTRLMVAMVDQCRQLIEADGPLATDLPVELRPEHLLWMCDKIRDHAADWPSTKLHRWIGFIQGAMIANRLLNLAGAKSMFDSAKAAHGEISLDQDLIDHLDPTSSFRMDLRGQG
jgi:hypothetical protein